MNTKDMQFAFYQHTFQRYEIVAPNIYLDWQFNEMDIIAIRKSGYVDEIEIKTSKADFQADFRKTVSVQDGFEQIGPHSYKNYTVRPKHDCLIEGLNHSNYFSFLIPEELEEKVNIPHYAGLYVARTDRNGIVRVHEKKSALLLHKRKISENHKYQIGRKMAYRYWQK